VDRPDLVARRVARDALVRFEGEDPDRARVHRTLDQVLRASGSVGAVDRALARELALGVVRRMRTIDTVLLAFLRSGLPDHAPTRAVLRLGAYQLGWTGIATYAAVDTAVSLTPPGGRRGLVNAVLRRLAGAIARDEAGPADHRAPGGARLALAEGRWVELALTASLPEPGTLAWFALEQGLPGWLVEGWATAYGETFAREIARAANAAPEVFLRADPGDAAAVRQRLAVEGIEVVPSPDHPDVLRVARGAGSEVFATDVFAGGRIVAQDPTAVRAADALGVAEGAVVLDLCAAPGTKTTRLARAVGPRGRVYALDPDPARCRRIEENVGRLGLHNVDVLYGGVDVLPPALQFDAALVDAPCSNTGVLARRPEVRHRLMPADIERLASIQVTILRDAVSRVRPGGRIVYSTCSLELRENRDVVRAVCSDLPLVLDHDLTTLPLAGRRDGGYFAVLRVAEPAANGTDV
jgi:16S rRNA (cytosine967-C5)-methyltransferase